MFRDLLKLTVYGAAAAAVKVAEATGVLEKPVPRCQKEGENHDYRWGNCKYCGAPYLENDSENNEEK